MGRAPRYHHYVTHLKELGLRLEALLEGGDLVLAGREEAPVVAVVHRRHVVVDVVVLAGAALVDAGDVLDVDDRVRHGSAGHGVGDDALHAGVAL